MTTSEEPKADRAVNEAENPDASLPEPAKTVVEERASEGKRPLEYEPEPDDDKGYPVASVEF